MNTSYQLGDILIFKAEEDYLSMCIAWLTNSDVSHSAMVYTENSIAESIAPGVVKSRIQVGMGDPAYLLRLTPAQDPDPLIYTAQNYMDAKTHYNFPALIYLGGLLLYSRIRPTYRLLSVAERFMSLACLELDNLLQKLLRHPNRTMVCSQFVYQVYYDCGENYRIRIHSEKRNELEQALDTIRLFDFCDYNLNSMAYSDNLRLEQRDSPESLVRQLFDSLYAAKRQDDIENTVQVQNMRILPVADLFLSKLQRLMDLLNTDMPINSLFVSPADFVYHAENLENKGEILVERIY